MVESYLFPLKISQSVYQSQWRLTAEEDLAGFSNLDSSELRDIELFLKRNDEFVMNGITGEDTMLRFIGMPADSRSSRYTVEVCTGQAGRQARGRCQAAGHQRQSIADRVRDTLVEPQRARRDDEGAPRGEL